MASPPPKEDKAVDWLRSREIARSASMNAREWGRPDATEQLTAVMSGPRSCRFKYGANTPLPLPAAGAYAFMTLPRSTTRAFLSGS